MCPKSLQIHQAGKHLESLLKELDIEIESKESEITVKAASISWSRAARRAKQRGESVAGDGKTPTEPLLVCTLTCTPYVTEVDGQTEQAAELRCTWRWGSDRHAFESFFTYLVRKLAAYAN